jgi:NADPH:quinone reductase-like Zn-dependent oxidoreductase
MRALQLVRDGEVQLSKQEVPPLPRPTEVHVRIHALALNHIDVWGFRGMAFVRRKFPLVVGAEAAGTVVAIGSDVTHVDIGDRVTPYGALTCGHCKPCCQGQDNLCESVSGIMGFHVDGFGRDFVTLPQRLLVKIPPEVSFEDAACAPIAFGTVQHMLFDNAKLQPGETILVHAGGSGIGTAAIQMAKAIGCTVITTVGSEEKALKAKSLGADHVINYRDERFEGVVRKITSRQGVDVVFEHVGADTWQGSLLCLKKGGRLVTCGATSGPNGPIDLMRLFQQQYKIFGSFGCTLHNISQSLEKMAEGIRPVIDTVLDIHNFEQGIHRLAARDVFGKIVIRF